MKKVLIIAYYWPPAGGAGVQRVLKFSKYLPQFGWEPIILTVNSPDCPIEDKSLLNDIPIGTKVYKTKALEPFNFYKKITGKKVEDKISSDILVDKSKNSVIEKISRWIRLNVFIPDAKIGWIPYAYKEGLRIIEKENIDIILSSSPPHTVQIIAKKLAAKTNTKWIADFRDPWMEIVHYQNVKRNALTKIIERKLEKSVLKNANIVITISKNIVDLFKSKVIDQKYIVIPNGYDETDFKETQRTRNDYFTIAYTGVITKTRVPYVFLEALKKFVKNFGNDKIRLVVAGRSCKDFKDTITKNDLDSLLDEKGFIAHHESTMILQSSDALLLVIDDVPDNKGYLTGKIFEYLGAKTPIYAIGPINGDANEILKESNSGKMIEYQDIEGAYNLLVEMYQNWIDGKSEYNYNVEKYSRKNQTEELSKIFNEQIL